MQVTLENPSQAALSGESYRRLRAWHPELTAFRRDLHAHPELAFEEVRTAGRIVNALRLIGVDEIHEGVGRTGIVGIIRGRHGRSTCGVALRADMDALPIAEETQVDWKSTRSGVMHGCGHDGHTAILVGAARYLAETRNFDGYAVLVFQPAEEGAGGAQAMIDDGLFERFPIDSIFALHNWPSLKAGTIGLNPGAMMAAADRVEIVINGRGGHGAHPDQTIDPVMVAAQIIVATQSIVSRNVEPVDSAVVSLCSLSAGNPAASNVIPRQAKLVGTVRTLRPEVQNLIEERLGQLVSSIARAFGAEATLKFERMFPATVNCAEQAALAASVAESLVGPDCVVRDLPPSMGAEDFSFMLRHKPGAYLRLGQSNGVNCALHDCRYDFNDEVLPLGAALMASLVERGLAVAGGRRPDPT